MTEQHHCITRPGEQKPAVELRLKLRADRWGVFYPLLSAGVLARTVEGANVRTTLLRELGLSEEYVSRRVTTVFLDGKPVPDIDAALLMPGSVLALSGVLPEPFLRHGVGWKRYSDSPQEHGSASREAARISYRLKVFNILLGDLTPKLLGSGVFVQSRELEGFLAGQDDRFPQGLDGAFMDGAPIPLSQMRNVRWSECARLIKLIVTADSAESR
ncbi:MAG: hypothetical protein AB1646_26710 [Thermodesulfobacteriota bacterium]